MTIPENVVFRNLAGEGLLVHLGSGTYFGLNQVGTRTWELIAGGSTPDSIVRLLLTEFDVNEDQLRRDVNDLIGQLLGKGLLNAHAPDASPSR